MNDAESSPIVLGQSYSIALEHLAKLIKSDLFMQPNSIVNLFVAPTKAKMI